MDLVSMAEGVSLAWDAARIQLSWNNDRKSAGLEVNMHSDFATSMVLSVAVD